MRNGNEDDSVRLLIAEVSSRSAFKLAMQDAFRVAAEADFGDRLDEPIPSDEDIERAFNTAGAITYWIVSQGQRVGGAVVVID